MLISPFFDVKLPAFLKLPVALISTPSAVMVPLFSKSVAVFTTSFPVNVFSEFAESSLD